MKIRILITAAFIAAALIFNACSASPEIVEKPISFSDERTGLTREYIKTHYNIDAAGIDIEPKIIVLHWTAINDFDSCFNLFNREKLEGSRPDLESAGQVNVSVPFLVDKDGTVYQLMPENKMGRHCIGLNYNSIGIENVGGGNNEDNITDEQIDANIKLVRYLKEKYPSIEYLIGHYEYREFEGHPLWLELDEKYRTEKVDPGDRMMTFVRAKVDDLKLKGVGKIREEKGEVVK